MMKKFIFVLLAAIGTFAQVQAQSIITGAWKFTDGKNEHHLFFQDGFFFHTQHNGNQFVITRGGYFKIEGNKINVLVLFNSADTLEVNKKESIPFSIDHNFLALNLGKENTKFERVDDGKAPLAGVWQISGRMADDGKLVEIHQTGTRQTYKMLTSKKFQWVAIDPAKKQFMGTGGGTYSFTDGKYTEKIEFFSRDNTRVGASLTFDGKLQDGKWHHSGLSSKGAKIYEVWSKVKASPIF